MIFRGVGAQVGDSVEGIAEHAGERGVEREAIVDGGDSDAVRQPAPGDVGALAFLAAAFPGAAVDVDDERERAVAGRDVEIERLVGFGRGGALHGVGDVGLVEHDDGAGRHLGDAFFCVASE